METATKGMKMRDPLINLKTTIYTINHLIRQLVDFLKTYSCITYVTNCLNVKVGKVYTRIEKEEAVP